MISVIGVRDETNRLPEVQEATTGPEVPHTVPDDKRLLLQETLDVRLHTLAHLQAQGGTPTAGASEPADAREPQGVGTVDSRLIDFQAPMEPQGGGAQREGGIASLICAYPWPQGCDYWIGVAQCESTLGQNPNAYADWNPYVGLLQIWIGHNYGREWLKDDANNVLAAWELSHEGTYTGAWPYCQ